MESELDKLVIMALLRRRIKRKRRYWVHPLNLLRPALGEHLKLELMHSSHPEQFFQYTRLLPHQFDYLLRLMESRITRQDTNFREAIPARVVLFVTLRYLSTGDSIRTIATSFSLGRSTVWKILRDTTKHIWECLLPISLKVPSDEDWIRIIEDYENIWNFPNCFGAIDGKHVVLQAPANSGSVFYNYKGTFSVVLLATCDADYRFTTVDVGAYGRQSDGGVLANSALGRVLEEGKLPIPGDRAIRNSAYIQPCTLIGDDAFAMSSYMLKPYPGNLAGQIKKRIFNYRLSRARRVIENCFGILASRFRIFGRPINADPENACNIIKAAVALHNYLRTEELDLDLERRVYCPAGFVDENDESNGAWRSSRGDAFRPLASSRCHTFSRGAKQMRENLATYFVTTGAVEWQTERAGLSATIN